MLMRSVVLVVLLAMLGGINASDVTDSRPDGITGATWQFGPLNRWAYTHIREILPTKNIANDLTNYSSYSKTLKTSENSRINLAIYEALKSSASIEDNRSLYY